MRPLTRSRPYVCLQCQLKTGRLCLATCFSRPTNHLRRPHSSKSQTSERELEALDTSLRNIQTPSTEFSSGFTQTVDAPEDGSDTTEVEGSRRSQQTPYPPVRQTKAHASTSRGAHPVTDTYSVLRHFATSASAPIELSEAQQGELKIAHSLRQRLSRGLSQVPEIKKDPSVLDGIPIDGLLKALPKDGVSPIEQKLIDRLGTEFTGQSFGSVKSDLDLATAHRNPAQRRVTDPKAKATLARLGVVREVPDTAQDVDASKRTNKATSTSNSTATRSSKGGRYQPMARMVAPQQTSAKKLLPKVSWTESKLTPSPFKKSNAQTVEARDLVLDSVHTENDVQLPQLSFDLSRVLFNPGVYHLQDPRSRVYNFDPYLEQIMPVAEFNFEALNPYQTSSEDELLLKLARTNEKRYIGSSSSMTSVLSHFHFLISQWRELNTNNLSHGFQADSRAVRSFTVISRSPAAIFLRYREGVYAVDADKEYDEPNVLMSLGKSMEKLLTLEKGDFETWRRTNTVADKHPVGDQPEAFHYSQQGRFLLRSQLDAHDPRLPGTGYFDLKTRAVAGIRMNIRETEAGMGYQIKERFGKWESFEREYYDMMRSTFLKYSLQARMGAMDGIFVAYHNIQRMFGFQYIPISEMDLALHGQSDPCLGDQEFRFSINFMEEIFNKGTQAFPNRSLRIHFETREATLKETKPYMHIFIEPMSEPNIKLIQDTNKAQFESFEKKILRGEDPGPLRDVEEELNNGEAGESSESNSTTEEVAHEDPPLPESKIITGPTGPVTSAANTEFLTNILNTNAARTKPKLEKREVMGLKLTIQNKINERPLERPESISASAKWTMDYHLESLGDEEAMKMYRSCRSKRTSALQAAINRGSDDYFIRSLRELSERGAEWRRKQDELDAQRERVVLYEDRQLR